MGVGAEGGWFAFSGGAQRQVQAWYSGVGIQNTEHCHCKQRGIALVTVSQELGRAPGSLGRPVTAAALGARGSISCRRHRRRRPLPPPRRRRRRPLHLPPCPCARAACSTAPWLPPAAAFSKPQSAYVCCVRVWVVRAVRWRGCGAAGCTQQGICGNMQAHPHSHVRLQLPQGPAALAGGPYVAGGPGVAGGWGLGGCFTYARGSW